MSVNNKINHSTFFLRGLQALITVLSLTMALISRTLIKDDLIPEQLGFLGTVGGLFILLGLLITLIYQSKIQLHISKYLLSAAVALLLLLLFQINFVENVNYGGDGAKHRFLRGFSITAKGVEMRQNANDGESPWSEAQYISAIGDDRIPDMYGFSYTINQIIYSLSYIIFMFSVVLTFGSLIGKIGDNQKFIDQQGNNKMKILFLAANPSKTSRLDLEEELRGLELELNGVAFRNQIELISRHAVRPDDLLRYVREDRPTVIHFSGHGSSEGIILRSDDGGFKAVTGASLRRFLEGRGVELVVLNACYSQNQADEIKQVVKAVVGTSDVVEDEAARRFTIAFYRTLGNGLAIQDAFRDGGDVVALYGLKDVFYSSGKLDHVFVEA